ncbi:hypothetical protein BG004_000490, partial [Podila humilis]
MVIVSSGLILVLATASLHVLPTAITASSSLSSSAEVIDERPPFQYNSGTSRRLTGRFLHITDIHPDEHYIAGGSISSACHRTPYDDDDNKGDDENKGDDKINNIRLMRPGRTDGGIGGEY